MHRKYWELWKEETKAVCLDTSNATMTLSRNILARELVVLYSITSSVRVNNCQYLYNSIRKDIRTEDSNGCLSRAGISSQLLSLKMLYMQWRLFSKPWTWNDLHKNDIFKVVLVHMSPGLYITRCCTMLPRFFGIGQLDAWSRWGCRISGRSAISQLSQAFGITPAAEREY